MRKVKILIICRELNSKQVEQKDKNGEDKFQDFKKIKINEK